MTPLFRRLATALPLIACAAALLLVAAVGAWLLLATLDALPAATPGGEAGFAVPAPGSAGMTLGRPAIRAPLLPLGAGGWRG